MALLDNIAAYWKMEESSGNSRVDATSGGHDLTDSGGVPSTTGIIGNAAGNFDGSADYLYSTDKIIDMGAGNAYSISFWIEGDTSANNGRAVNLCSSSNGAELYLRFNTSTEIVARFFDGATTYDSTTQAVSASGTRYHVVITVDTSNDMRFYVNNSEVGTATAVGATRSGSAPANGVSFGRHPNVAGNWWKGNVDEVAVWDGKTLDSSEISQLYNSGSGLQYPFGESSTNSSFFMFM
jgi:hypothetical protein